MKVLIWLNRQGEKRYEKVLSDEEVMHFVSAKYKDHKIFFASYGSKPELMEDVREWLSGDIGLPVQDKACIFEPEKEGYYIATHNSHGLGLEVTNFFFVCDEGQLTEQEKSKLNAGN